MEHVTINLAVFGAAIGAISLLSQLLGAVIKQSKELGKMEARIEAEFKLQAQQRHYEDEMMLYRIEQLENFAQAKAGYKVRSNPQQSCTI